MPHDVSKAIAMLPDLTVLKHRVQERLNAFARERQKHYVGPFADASKMIIREGAESVIVRGDGTQDTTEIVTAETEISLTGEELEVMTLAEALRQTDEMVKNLAAQMSKHFYQTMFDATERSGNVVDNRGMPLTAETFLQVLEKMQIDFDGDDWPSSLKIVIPPSMEDRVKQLHEEFETNIELQRKHEQLVEKKRSEYVAREASRKLVG